MNKKIKSLKSLLIALGAVLLFSNSMGLLVDSMMFTETNFKPTSGVDLLFANFGLICLSAITIGALNLFGGLILKPKNKNSRHIVILTSVISMICIIAFSIILMIVTFNEGLGFGVSLIALFSGLLFSSPFVFLIIYLNKGEIKGHFS